MLPIRERPPPTRAVCDPACGQTWTMTSCPHAAADPPPRERVSSHRMHGKPERQKAQQRRDVKMTHILYCEACADILLTNSLTEDLCINCRSRVTNEQLSVGSLVFIARARFQLSTPRARAPLGNNLPNAWIAVVGCLMNIKY